MAVLADSIDGNGIYAMRAEADKDGNRIDLTYAKLTDIPAAQVQSNWSESDSSAVSYIQNKPSNLVQDASYVHTDENFTSAEKTKLAGIAAGAEVNVQANWTESDSSSDAFIQNKPQNLVQDASYVHTDENFTSAEKTKLAGIEANAEVNVQSDWNESDSSSDAYIQNKPTISNVPAVTSSDDAKVLKASYSGGVGSYSWETETGTTYSAGTGIDIDQNNAISVENPLPASTSADEGKVLKVDANGDPEWATGGGGSQVQSDWAETDTTDPSYIENKPTPKTLVAGQGIAISESSASLTVTNTVARDAVNLVAGSGVTLTQSGSDLTISSAGTTYTAGTGIDITNDEISLEAPVDLVGGPGIVVDNPDGNTVRVSQSTFGAWENITDQFTWASNATDNGVRCLYNTTLKLLWMQGYVHLNVGTSSTKVCTLPSSLKTQLRISELSMASTLEEKHGLLSTNLDRTELHFKWVTAPSNKYVGFFLICPMEEV